MVSVGSGTAFSLRLPPVAVKAPVSILLGDDAEEEPDSEDDLAAEDDDVIDFDKLDDSEEPMGADDSDDRQGDCTGAGNDHED